jgi:2,3-dimethylmalate lyase
MVLAPFVYDALSAQVAARIGFDALYMTGFGTAASLGMPDVGLATVTEMAANISRIVEASGLPVIADADTGYGNPINVGCTVRSYERAGAAGLHIEDQVFPQEVRLLRGQAGHTGGGARPEGQGCLRRAQRRPLRRHRLHRWPRGQWLERRG